MQNVHQSPSLIKDYGQTLPTTEAIASKNVNEKKIIALITTIVHCDNLSPSVKY